MPVAAIVAAGALTAGASVIASGKASKASQKAVDAQTAANSQSLAVQQQVRDENKGILNPYVQTGYSANNVLAGLLGTGGDAAASNAAFDRYRGSTGYTFRTGEGMKALNSNFAGRGLINSGAAQKAAIQYGQNAASDEFGRYVGQLTGQQQVGLSAGNALAGVGTTFANNATNINNSTASAVGNGALTNASINGGMLTNLSGIAGNTIGALSSYGGLGGAPQVGAGGYGGGTFYPGASQYGLYH